MQIQDGKKLGMWFAPPYPGCEPRHYPIDIFVGHWTGAESDKPVSEDFKRVFTNLKNRHDLEGKPMPLSVDFIINGTDGIMQCSDPFATVCYHAGKVNKRAMGVEVVMPGNGEESHTRPRETITTTIRGKKLKQFAYSPAQLSAYLFLCEHVAKTYNIPKVVAPDMLLTNAQIASFRGFLEHYQVSSKKSDGGGQLNAHLLANGWTLEGEEPRPKLKPRSAPGRT